MIGGGLGGRRRAYRSGQSAVLFGLATLVLLAFAVGPLFERAVEQAAVRSTLGHADRVSRGMIVTVPADSGARQGAPSGPAAQLFQPPVHAIETSAVLLGTGSGAATYLVYRDGQCAHLHLIAGRCPSAVDEVLASASTAAALHLHVGSRVALRLPNSRTANLTVTQRSTVVGLYLPFAGTGDYWFGAHYSSSAGIVRGSASSVDVFFGTRDALVGVGTQLADLGEPGYQRSFVNLALRPDRVGVGDLPLLRRALAARGTGGSSSVQSALPQYLQQIDVGRRAARTVVLPVALALALLATLAFGVVVAAAAEQRRPELALARLRGSGVGAASNVFLGEIGVLTVAAVVPALALAWLATAAACRLWLVTGVGPELRWPALAAAGGGLLLVLVIVAVIGRRASGQQITDMLRRLPARRSRLGLGLMEAVVAVAAVAGLAASLGGGRHSALALLTPTLVALVVGLFLSRMLVIAARPAGRRAFWRGRLVAAIAALNIARRPGSRLTVTVLCLATALLVFAGQQWSVAAANRSERAAAETGAAVSLDVQAPDEKRLVDAVDRADPGHSYAAPVVVVDPPGVDAVSTVAVDPASFGAVASWGRAGLHPSRAELERVVPAHRAPPATFTGDTVRLSASAASFRLLAASSGGGPPVQPSASLQLDFRRSDGAPVQADLGRIPGSGGAHTFTGSVLCDDGCHLTGIEVVRPILDQSSVAVDVTVDRVEAGADGRFTALSLGRPADWATTTRRTRIPQTPDYTAMTATGGASGLRFRATDDGSGTSMHYLEVPVALPALLAGPTPDARDALGFVTGTLLDASTGRLSVVGSLPFVPQVGNGVVVDLPLAAAASSRLDAIAHPQVWLRTDDPTREKRLVTALHAAGITVVQRTSSARAAQQYARSAPGWSALFALVVGVLAVLLAVGLLVLVVLTSRRVREDDLAAMRLDGLTGGVLRRATALELAVFVLTGIVAGAVAGLIGVRLSLSAVPIFTTPAAVALPSSFGLRWLWVAGTVAVSVVLLAPVATALGTRVAARATPYRAVRDVA